MKALVTRMPDTLLSKEALMRPTDTRLRMKASFIRLRRMRAASSKKGTQANMMRVSQMLMVDRYAKATMMEMEEIRMFSGPW